MPTISPEISIKISGLLKSMGKVSEQSISEAKKKYEGNGKTPLGILSYLLEDKKIAEDGFWKDKISAQKITFTFVIFILY